MVEKALGKNYFQKGRHPIYICKVNRKQNISFPNDYTEILHYHDFTEIIFITKGSSTHFVEGNEYSSSSGDVYIIHNYQAHYFKDASNIEIISVMFDKKRMPGLLNIEMLKKIPGYSALFILEPNYKNQNQFDHVLHLNRKELSKIEMLLNAMFIEQKEKEAGYETILKNRLEELIIHLSRKYSTLESREAVSLLRIGSMIEYLENNYKENIHLDKLADMSYMSVRNFQRIFKKATGQTPIDYLIHIRIDRAKYLLRESELSVVEIALETGFKEHNYFSRKFKAEAGISPLKYRMRFKPGSR